MLHPTLSTILGTIGEHERRVGNSDNENIFNKLKQILNSGGALQAWSDGSLINNEMGHGYIVRTRDIRDNEMLIGKGKTLGGSVRSSLRAEHSAPSVGLMRPQ